MATENYKVVVYGADLQGVFAAAKAAAELKSGKVALIVPYPKTRYQDGNGKWVENYLLGGIMTAGGLNNWDDRGYYNSSKPASTGIQQGSYFYYRTDLGFGFSRVKLAEKCRASMANGNVTLLEGYDIYDFASTTPPYTITSITVRKIERDSQGRIVWSSSPQEKVLNATVFIDASAGGRLARRVNSACTTGRYDWPANYLPSDEKAATDNVGRQQAATLLVKMRNINPSSSCTKLDGIPTSLWTSHETYSNPNGPIAAFNNKYKDSDGIMIKPANAARDGNGTTSGGAFSDDWWVNGLLVFNVDGRSHYRDDAAGTKFKVTRKYAYMTTDEAWIKTKNFIKQHKSEIEKAFRSNDGFENSTIVTDDRGDPVVGDLLYLRETVHMSISSDKRAHGTYDSNYRVTANETANAGNGPSNGADTGNYATRIGLAKYDCDIHPYTPSDYVSKTTGEYICGMESYKQMWPGAKTPANPVYMPYEVLRTSYVTNLLIPGYGAGVCSYSWGEVRVFSNLSVLGDAAGIAAGYCCNNNIKPYVLQNDANAIAAVQAKIKAIHGRIDK